MDTTTDKQLFSQTIPVFHEFAPRILHMMELIANIRNIGEHDCRGAANRQIIHIAGEALLTQSTSDYMQLSGIPMRANKQVDFSTQLHDSG